MADEFGRAISRMAIAQILDRVGFEAVQSSAIDALVDVMIQYIQQIGASSKDMAELAGRTKPCILDVLTGFGDMVPSTVNLKDLIKMLEKANDSFPADIPEFPLKVAKPMENESSLVPIGKQESLPPYVPSFLPPLPNPHTYRSKRKTIVVREDDPKRIRTELQSQKAKVQQSLNNIVINSTNENGLPKGLFMEEEEGEDKPMWTASLALGGSIPEDTNKRNAFMSTPKKMKDEDDLLSFRKTFLPVSTPVKELIDNDKMDENDRHEMGKEEKILTGTFHDGDSE